MNSLETSILNNLFSRTFIAVSVSLLAACSTTAVQVPEAGTDTPTNWSEPHQIQQGSLSRQLLDLINNPELESLVQGALLTNHDLQKTANNLSKQRLLTGQSNAARLPKLTTELSSTRQDGGDTPVTNQHKLGLNLSWELDIWGKLSDAYQAENAKTVALEADYQAAADSLSARIIQAWVDISYRNMIIKTEQARIDALLATEDIIKSRFVDGLGELNDLETARAATARAKATLATLQQAQNEAYRSLSLLRGDLDTDTLPLAQQEITIQAPPVVIPAQVIANRPDIRSAYQKIVSASASQSVAEKQLLPSFNLSASLSQSRPQVGDLLSGSSAWNLLGSLTAPLFDGGRLKASADIAALDVEQSYLDYQITLLTALNEVENALGQEATLAEKQALLSTALTHSENSLSYYQQRYRDGLSTILELLTAQRSTFDARIQLLETQQSRLTNRITLGLALGMGV